VVTRSLELALSLVAEGEACAYLPLSICQELIDKGEIVEVTGPMKAQAPLTLFLVYHDKNFQPKRVALFKDFLALRLSK
jgi:DNA-binding transcriptional LysR family regulator